MIVPLVHVLGYRLTDLQLPQQLLRETRWQRLLLQTFFPSIQGAAELHRDADECTKIQIH